MRIKLIVSAFLGLLITPGYAQEKASSKKELSDFDKVYIVLSIVASSGYIIRSGFDFYHFICKTAKPKSEDQVVQELLSSYALLTMKEGR